MKFFKTLLASILGTLIGISLIVFIFFIIGISSTGESEPYIKSNSVLNIELSGSIPDRTVKDPFQEIINPSSGKKVSMEGLKVALEKADSDRRISGVLLNVHGVGDSWAKLEEVRDIIAGFRDRSDKFLYATTNDIGYSEQGYFLATAADSIFSPPESFFEFDGFYIQTAFYENMFEKFGIKPEITRKGKFKSAVEPYFREEYSSDNELQLNAMLEKFSDTYLNGVNEATGIAKSDLNALLNGTPSLSMKDAIDNGLVHQGIYSNQLDSLIKERIAVEKDEKLNKVSYGRYSKVSLESAGVSIETSSDKIAVLNTSGIILPVAPEGFPGMQQNIITANNFKEELENIREDENIKALVLRVDSPGGSGTTSDLIWQMLRETANEIPVIASMGSVAASGGYYIAMAADTIVAMPTSITGSIGVFNTKFNTRELFSDKIGVTFDVVKTHEHADWLDPQNVFSDEEQQAFQRTADQFYQTFITKVSKSRPLSVEEVDERAQGRVWVGADAREQQLVDVLGGLDKAIKIAAGAANLEHFSVESFPKEKDLFEILYGNSAATIKTWLSPQNPFQDILKPVQEMFTLQNGHPLTLMPYKFKIK